MSLSWITPTAKLQYGIDIINSISQTSFSKLLEQILNKTKFTELNNLDTTLGLCCDNIELLVQTATYIFKQSSKVILKPTTLQKQLVENLKFNNDKAEEFVKAWTSHAKQDLVSLEGRLKLEHVSWELNVQIASSLKREIVPNIRLKLNLKDSKYLSSKNVVVELDKTELQQFYITLDNIQNKLDFLRENSETGSSVSVD
ncbi:hypothetical protein FQA39_LY15312 [Lamprigera yunnana]|nr:hypothetical protein FQA39_LY15312 [Lamprigera yunnana]